jgi:molybdenum cofactor cytidylyltransferase
MRQDPSISLGALILAAGSSSRMGRAKMLLPWGETTVLGHLIALWARLPAAQIAVVCAPADAAIVTELDRVRFPLANRIVNPDPGRGMFSSIQCAAGWPGWNAALTHWAVILGDQPHLRPATLDALADFAARHPRKICQPVHGGHAGHPVILPAEAFAALKGANDESLKQFLQRKSASVQWLELDDPGLGLDLDHPADYERARRLAFGG